MSESIKSVLLLVFIVTSLAGGVAWYHDRPDAVVWTWRWILTFVAVTSVSLVFLLQARRDLVPEFLGQLHGGFLNCNGLCFAYRIEVIDGIAYAVVDFQNQFEGPCRGIVALRPARKFFMNREPIAHIMIPIVCPPAGFGTSAVPMAIPQKLQGRRVAFEVGATVQYPEGKGKRLRFTNGVFLRANANMKDHVQTTIMIASFATGSIVYFSPTKWTATLPRNVSEDIPSVPLESLKIHWQLSDTSVPS